MIIFGTRGVKSTMEEGTFLCPQCNCEERYKYKKVTNFFTLYFIPLIPLGKAGEYVECQRCYGTFVSRVLDYNPREEQNDFQSEYEKALRHTMVLIMLADGEIDDGEMDVVLHIINKYSYHDMTLDELDDYVHDVQQYPEPVDTYLRRVAPSLNEHGKELIIRSAIAVAYADNNLEDSEVNLINEMAQIMEMSKTHLKGIWVEMAKEPTFSDN